MLVLPQIPSATRALVVVVISVDEFLFFFLFDDLVQVMTPCAHRHLLLLMLSGHYHRHGFC